MEIIAVDKNRERNGGGRKMGGWIEGICMCVCVRVSVCLWPGNPTLWGQNFPIKMAICQILVVSMRKTAYKSYRCCFFYENLKVQKAFCDGKM